MSRKARKTLAVPVATSRVSTHPVERGRQGRPASTQSRGSDSSRTSSLSTGDNVFVMDDLVSPSSPPVHGPPQLHYTRHPEPASPTYQSRHTNQYAPRHVRHQPHAQLVAASTPHAAPISTASRRPRVQSESKMTYDGQHHRPYISATRHHTHSKPQPLSPHQSYHPSEPVVIPSSSSHWHYGSASYHGPRHHSSARPSHAYPSQASPPTSGPHLVPSPRHSGSYSPQWHPHAPLPSPPMLSHSSSLNVDQLPPSPIQVAQSLDSGGRSPPMHIPMHRGSSSFQSHHPQSYAHYHQRRLPGQY